MVLKGKGKMHCRCGCAEVAKVINMTNFSQFEGKRVEFANPRTILNQNDML